MGLAGEIVDADAYAATLANLPPLPKSRPAGFTPWSLPPHSIGGLGRPGDPIPVTPPTNYTAGSASIFSARTKPAMKIIPDWELIAHFLRAPDLVFADWDRDWHRQRWAAFVRVRQEVRLAAKDGNDRRYARLVAVLRYRWRQLVQRSIGLRHMGGKVTGW